MSLKKIASDNKWFDCCCMSIDYDKENRKTIYDYTDKAGALFSGSYDIYNKKKQMVDTVYIKEVIYNNPVTIVFWSDGTKTKSKAPSKKEYDRADGFIYCIIKKLSCNSLDKLFEEWLPRQEQLIEGPIKVTLKDVRMNSK